MSGSTRSDELDERIVVDYENSPCLLIEGKTYTAEEYEIEYYGDGGAMVKVEMSGELEGTNVFFTDNKVAAGSSEAFGGAVNTVGRVTLTSATFTGNYADFGGALYNDGTATFVGETTFSGNSAYNYGGAFYNENNGKVTFADKAIFSGNHVTVEYVAGWGGAFYNDGSTTFVGDAIFTGNSANSDGGALYNDQNGNVTFAGNAIFSGNYANEGEGGAIYNWKSTINMGGTVTLSTGSDTWVNAGIDIENSTVNWDLTNGKTQYGSIQGFQWYSNSNAYVMQNLLVQGKNADAEPQQSTGAYIIASGDLSDAATASNGKYSFVLKAGEDAGQTIDLASQSAVNYEGRNYKLINSGNKYLVLASYKKHVSSRVDLSGTEIDINATYGDLFQNIQTNISGGGLFIKSDSSVIGNNLMFINISSYSFGGAIYNCSGSTLTLTGTADFIGNTAVIGGAIYNQSGTLTITGPATFAGNTVMGSGGAILNAKGCVTFAAGATFTGNSATSGGAIYNANGGTVTFAGVMELATASDTWVNKKESENIIPTVNWDLTGGLEQYGSIKNYQYYSNLSQGEYLINQNITVKADQAAGEYILATGDLSDADGDATGKYIFKATIDGTSFSGNITLGADAPVNFKGNNYSLAIDDNGTAGDATDDKLVLTISSSLVVDVSVDDSLVGKWFSEGETVVLTGTYNSEIIPTITVDGEAATVDHEMKTWSYTYGVQPDDTKGTEVAIAITAGAASADTTYNLKVDTVNPEISVELTSGGTAYTEGTWTNQSVVGKAIFTDATSGIDGSEYDDLMFNQESDTSAGTLITIMTADKAGNTQSKNVAVKIDKTGPAIAEVTADNFAGDSKYVDGDKVWFRQGDTSARLNVAVTDAKSGLKEAYYNGILYDATGKYFELDTIASGTGKIVATDNAGNMQSSSSISYLVDGTTPDISVTVTPDTALTDLVTVSVSANDGDGSGMKYLKYSIDGEDYVDYSDAFQIDHNCTITFKAVDNVGNEIIAIRDITNIVTEPPVITITADTKTIVDTLEFSANATSEQSHVKTFQYTTNTATGWTDYENDQLLTVNAKGTYTFQATDAAKNQTTESVTFHNIYSEEERKQEIKVSEGVELAVASGDSIETKRVEICQGGKLTVSEQAKLQAKNLVMDGGILEISSLSNVKSGNINISGTGNEITGGLLGSTSLVTSILNSSSLLASLLGSCSLVSGLLRSTTLASSVTVDKDSDLTISKDQYDLFMNGRFYSAGEINVKESSGNVLTQDDVALLAKIGTISSVNFQQELLGINKLTFDNDYLSVGFTGALGTSKADTITVKKSSKVVLGTAGSTLDLLGGSNKIQIDANASFQLNSDLVNITKVTADSGTKVKIDKTYIQQYTRADFQDISMSASTSSTLDFGKYSITSTGNITGGTKADEVIIGADSIFRSGSIALGGGKNTVTIGNRSTATVNGALDGINTIDVQAGKSGSVTSLTAGDVTGTANNDSFKFGNYSAVELDDVFLGSGNDKLTVGDYADVNIGGLLTFGAGSDILTVGHDSEVVFKAESAIGLSKFTLGKNSTAYLSSELADAFAAKGKASSGAVVFDIGSADTAVNFSSIADECSDNSVADARSLDEADYSGWLSSTLDNVDFFSWSDATNLARTDGKAGDLSVSQYDANGSLIEGSTCVFGDQTIKRMEGAATFVVSMLDENKKATSYNMHIA